MKQVTKKVEEPSPLMKTNESVAVETLGSNITAHAHTDQKHLDELKLVRDSPLNEEKMVYPKGKVDCCCCKVV